jgi:hypothetical protein
VRVRAKRLDWRGTVGETTGRGTARVTCLNANTQDATHGTVVVLGLQKFVCIAALCFSAFTCPESVAQNPHAGSIAGHIDGIVVSAGGPHVRGWACQQSRPESITVHIYADEGASDAPRGIFALAGKADLGEEPAVDAACKDTVGRKHRFDIPLPGAILVKLHGKRLFVHGIRVVGSVENAAIAGSGTIKFPDAPPVRHEPAAYPHLAGRYATLDAHPRVFDTSEELQDIARRANSPASFTSKQFSKLAGRVRQDLAAKVDWQATYSGCDLEIYLRGFSYEQKPAYGNDRSDDELRTAMKGRPGLAPPHGAAIVAARAALYAALVHAGAVSPAGAPSSNDAAAFAKRILLAWADHGFRDEKGIFRRTEDGYCDLDPNGKPHVTQFGTFNGALTHSRGVIYSVHAQDLLEGIDGLTRDEQTRVDTFHHNMFDTIRSINNQEYDLNMKMKYSDEVYNNQFVAHLTALLSISRLFDDEQDFDAALNGGEGSRAVKLPWIELFDHVIYGANDTPLLNITPNSSVDPIKNHPSFSTTMVAAGEINDRYRHDNPSQTIGYPMGSLQGLYMAAELMKNAGLDAYAYRGAHGQSVEMATSYYACFAKYAGFAKVITAENSSKCQDATQYLGVIVNGVGENVLIGAYRFPDDAGLIALDALAKANVAGSALPPEPILFGKWRD